VFHDEDGNLDCVTRPGADPERDCSRSGGEPSPLLVQDFAYDYRDRLEAWERPEDELSVSYEHDALDRPIRETEVSNGTTTVHELSYIGATRQLAEEEETTEEEGAGVRHRTRSYSHDAYGRLVGMSYRAGQGGGDPVHELSYAFDPRDNVSMLLDKDGAVKAAYGYSAYGEPDELLTAEQLPGSTDAPGEFEQVNPFRYSSKRTDALSDTIDMGARQFGPQLGQFLQADQYDSALADLGLSSDPLTGNRYTLAGGNPISYIEVDGHMLCPRAGDCGRQATQVNRLAANAQRAPAGSGAGTGASGGGSGGSGSGGAQSTGSVFEQSLTSSLPLLGDSPDGAGADSADDSEEDGGGGGLPSPVDAITGAADLLEDVAVEHVMHQTTCAAESPQLVFWNTECFEESKPDPKATFEACTQGNIFEAGGRLAVCGATVVGTRRGLAPRATTGTDDVPASTPVGSSRSPMNAAGSNRATRIHGRAYSRHALDRMQGRGIVPSVVEDTIRYGISRRQGLFRRNYYSEANDLTVITSWRGRVITTGRGQFRRGR
jgi:RHS repeat-associated protein